MRKLVESGVGIAVITDGVNGSYAMTETASLKVPTYPVEVEDSTGAGDVFISGLAAYLDEGLEWACAVASASSSAIVETHGPKILCTRKEIMQRAEIIYEKIQKLSESSSGDPVDC
jgi:sugar/nucleoside kinase (ribokinase family)